MSTRDTGCVEMRVHSEDRDPIGYDTTSLGSLVTDVSNKRLIYRMWIADRMKQSI